MARSDRDDRHRGRWNHARRLIHDHTIELEDRVAGLLVPLYSPSRNQHVHVHNEHVGLRLADEPIALPGPLADLITQQTRTRRGHAVVGEPVTS